MRHRPRLRCLYEYEYRCSSTYSSQSLHYASKFLTSSEQSPYTLIHTPLTLTPSQAYHSAFNDDPSVRQVGNTAILPISTKMRGPAPIACKLMPNSLCRDQIIAGRQWLIHVADPSQPDIIEEALDLYVPSASYISASPVAWCMADQEIPRKLPVPQL